MNKKLSILSVALIATMAGMVVSPALGAIKLAFPDADATLVRLISTMHSLVIIPFLFISGWLTKRVPKKTVLLTALLIYVAGGMSGALASSVLLILVTRAVLGVGVGLLLPLVPSLVADFFSGDERASMMGKVTGTNQVGGIIAFVLSGILAAISWRLPFVIYALALIAFIAVAIWLPKQPPLKDEKQVDGVKARIPNQVYLLGLAMFGVFLFIYTIPTNMALYVIQFQIAPPAAIGLIMACGTVGAMFAGMLFGRYKRLVRSYIVPVQILLASAAFFLISSSLNPYIIAGGILLFGFSYGTLVPLVYTTVSNAADKTQMVKSMSVVQILMYLAQFSSPIIFGFIAGLFGQVGPTATRFIYTFAAYAAGAIAVLAFIIVASKKKPKPEDRPQEDSQVEPN